jgi:ribosome biogenesis GTPase
MPDRELGWNDALQHAWEALGCPRRPGRASRLDRGWSTVMYDVDQPAVRVRNIGADVAVGDWVIISDDGERVETVIERFSAFTRRASFEGNRAVAHTIAANIDTGGARALAHHATQPAPPRT